MQQNFIPDVEFLKERSFESEEHFFKIKAERIFGRLFGDSEYIPLNFMALIDNSERIFSKENTEHNGGQIVFIYSEPISLIKIFIFL